MITLDIISSEAETINLESSTITPLTLKQYMPVFVNNISSFVNDLFTKKVVGGIDYRPDASVIAKLKNNPYITYADLIVNKPVGLQSDLLELISALKSCDEIVGTLVTDVLKPYKLWIGTLINQPDNITSLRNMTIIDSLRLKKTERAIGELSSCFNMEKQSGNDSLINLVPRATDWEIVTDSVVELDKTLGLVSRNVIKSEIDEITSMLNILFNNIENNKTDRRYKISSNNINIIAHTSNAVAKECDFYASHYYRLLTLVNTLRDIEKSIKAA